MSVFRQAILSVACVLGLAAGAGMRAQEQPLPVLDPEMLPRHFIEVNHAQVILLELVARAFALDPRLDDLRAAFEQARDQAMLARDPQTAVRRARLVELEALYTEAMTNSQSPDVGELIREGLTLRQALDATAAEVRAESGVAAPAAAYEAALRAAFTNLESIDPEMVRRIAESDQLLEIVSAMTSATP